MSASTSLQMDKSGYQCAECRHGNEQTLENHRRDMYAKVLHAVHHFEIRKATIEHGFSGPEMALKSVHRGNHPHSQREWIERLDFLERRGVQSHVHHHRALHAGDPGCLETIEQIRALRIASALRFYLRRQEAAKSFRKRYVEAALSQPAGPTVGSRTRRHSWS